MKTGLQSAGCTGCRDGAAPDFDIAMAFQPIVDMRTGRVFAYEALVRGARAEPAATVLAGVTEANRYAFDQRCRVKAIEGAVAAGILETGAKLSINFLPNAVYSPLACIQLTLRTARATGFPTERLIFEFTENEEMADPAHVESIIACYRQMGFGTAIDDFGAGFSGLDRLARFQPDYIKLDMELMRGMDSSLRRRQIVGAVVAMARAMELTVIAEGIETEAELDAVRSLGVDLIQGYLLARPGFQSLPEVRLLGPDRLAQAVGY